MLPVLVLSVLLHVTLAARDADLVTYVPGLDPQPPFKNYAGFLSASPERRFFYWFVESENDPANDPVVLWLNGGPGCSSLTGFLVELGPYRVRTDGSGLDWFEQRWNKIANIIFMESPQCVGYSYDNSTTCASGDNEVAYDNHMALKDFFEGFPEYKNNTFYVTGESYAGFYVPTLSARLVDDPEFNFKGFAVGNAVTDYDMMDNALVYFAWARGLFGTELWNNLVSECCVGANATDCDFQAGGPACQSLLAVVNNICWNSGLNPYQLYDDCYGGVPAANGIISQSASSINMMLPDAVPLLGQGARERYLKHFREMVNRGTPEVYASIPCTDTSGREIYLNNPEVRAALHVPDFVQRWEACSTRVSAQYSREYNTVAAEYHKVHERGHRILVFNGDLDIACNHLGDLWFVESLGKTLEANYQDWFWNKPSDNTVQIAGYVIQFENLVFLTVKGAGHFVPTDKPIPAYTMWEKFIYDQPYP